MLMLDSNKLRIDRKNSTNVPIKGDNLVLAGVIPSQTMPPETTSLIKSLHD